MYVCRTLERTVVEPSVSCFITPAPSLFAEPSSPSAMYAFSSNEHVSHFELELSATTTCTRQLERAALSYSPWHT